MIATFPYTDAERKQLQAVRDFNRDNPAGTWVTYTADGRTHHDRTIGKALVVGSGTAMKAIVGVAHGRNVALADITVIPRQPDGIDEYSSDLPDPHRAAARVNAWIAAWGDGLIDVTDGKPLYARDLEAICHAALDNPSGPQRNQPTARPVATAQLSAPPGAL